MSDENESVLCETKELLRDRRNVRISLGGSQRVLQELGLHHELVKVGYSEDWLTNG